MYSVARETSSSPALTVPPGYFICIYMPPQIVQLCGTMIYINSTVQQFHCNSCCNVRIKEQLTYLCTMHLSVHSKLLFLSCC